MLETQAHKKLHPRSAPRSVDAMKPPAAGASGSADAPRGEAPPLFGHEEPLARLLIRAAVAPQVESAAIKSVVLSVCENYVISVG